MVTEHTPGLSIEISPGTDHRGERERTRRLHAHFEQVSAQYRTLRELDLGAVDVISDVVARAASPGRPLRLLDVATGSGRYLDAVSHCVASTSAMDVVPIGLDLNAAMLTQARIRNGRAGLRAQHLVGSVEMLPFHTSSCDAITCFNAVHHLDLARFIREACRVLTPSGPLVIYTRTLEQNRRTIWGRYFPEFTARETRLPRVADLRAALKATGAFASVRTQTLTWSITTSLSRLIEQVTQYHYSTFRMYSDDALHTAIDTFRQHVRQAFADVTHITYDNDHMLVMAQRTATRGQRVHVPGPSEEEA